MQTRLVLRRRVPGWPATDLPLAATVGLILVATVTLLTGVLGHASGLVLASIVCTVLSAMALTAISRSKTAVRPAGVRLHAAASVPRTAARCAELAAFPIEDHDRLRVDEILPLLQELDGAALPVQAEERPFPIDGYDDLRVVDILPLLGGLAPEELDAVAARERSGAGRVTILTRITRLRQRPLRPLSRP